MRIIIQMVRILHLGEKLHEDHEHKMSLDYNFHFNVSKFRIRI